MNYLPQRRESLPKSCYLFLSRTYHAKTSVHPPTDDKSSSAHRFPIQPGNNPEQWAAPATSLFEFVLVPTSERRRVSGRDGESDTERQREPLLSPEEASEHGRAGWDVISRREMKLKWTSICWTCG